MGLAVGADQMPGAIEHRGRVVEIGAVALGVAEHQHHLVLARNGEERIGYRVRQRQEMLLVVLNQPVRKKGCEEDLGKADDIDALASTLLHHRAGGLDTVLHATEHRSRLRCGNRELSCH